MSEAEEQMWKAASLMRNLLRLNYKRLDRSLLEVIINALEEVGIQARERVERICLEEHSVTGGNDTDLLDYYYSSATDQSQSLVWLNPTDKKHRSEVEYYRSYWPESRFVFVGKSGCAVHLSLSCRLPKPTPRPPSIGLKLNGKPQVEILINSDWSTWDIQLPGEAVHDGLNEITIGWPMPEFESEKALETARLQLIERKFPDFFPVFGEIHSFTASDGRQVSSTTSPIVQIESSLVEVG
jgi:hypothetical protein